MKEKFSELYHLAWNYSEFDDEYKENPTYERRCVVQSRIFGELIVRECIDWCNAHAAIEGTAQKIVESIKKDFGVK